MDESLTPGELLTVGGDTYVVVQHPALARLATVICLPATREPAAHRPPLIYHDPTTGLWVHTYAPVTVPRNSAYRLGRRIPSELVDTITAGLVQCLGTEPLTAAKSVAAYPPGPPSSTRRG